MLTRTVHTFVIFACLRCAVTGNESSCLRGGIPATTVALAHTYVKTACSRVLLRGITISIHQLCGYAEIMVKHTSTL